MEFSCTKHCSQTCVERFVDGVACVMDNSETGVDSFVDCFACDMDKSVCDTSKKLTEIGHFQVDSGDNGSI